MLGYEHGVPTHWRLLQNLRRIGWCQPLCHKVSGMRQHDCRSTLGKIGALLLLQLKSCPERRLGELGKYLVR